MFKRVLSMVLVGMQIQITAIIEQAHIMMMRVIIPMFLAELLLNGKVNAI